MTCEPGLAAPRGFALLTSVVAVAAASIFGGSAHGAPATATFTPVADAYVRADKPATNAGTSTKLKADNSPVVRSYLRFDIQGLAGSVTRATLRVSTLTTHSLGFEVRAVGDDTWGERTITYSNAPAYSSTVTARSSAFSTGQTLMLDVTPLVTTNELVSIALTTTSTSSMSLASRENGAATTPALVVETANPDPTDVAPANVEPPTISGTPREGEALTAHPGTWTGTQPITYAYRWRRCDAVGGACADIEGATAQAYTLTAADVDATLRVVVTAGNAGGSSDATSAPSQVVQGAGAPGQDPVIAAAGDIACDPASSSFNAGAGTSSSCRQKAVSDLLVGAGLTAVLPLGDTQYECGGLSAFNTSYDPSWGRIKSITRPAIGNHEYSTTGGTDCDSTGQAKGYFDYFGAAAGDRAKGYYSFDIGSWHLVALNSNCSKVGGCGPGSAQDTWLRQDLAANPARCTLGFWHHPPFSSGNYRPGVASAVPLFQALYDYGADVALVGHDHNYERFAPQDPAGALDPAAGVRQFTVGTGGKNHHAFQGAIPNSEWRDGTNYGVLKLTLHDGSYDWQFVSESGVPIDSGSDLCEGTAPDTMAPTAPSALSATPTNPGVGLAWTASSDARGVIGYDVYRDGTLLGQVTASPTAYTDSTAASNTTYRYEVRARDAAGNVSAPSNEATATTGTSVQRTFIALADARVAEASPTANYGTSYLRTDGGSDPDVESYLRFTVGGTGGTVTSAKLRLWVRTGTADGPRVFAAPGGWTESAITWNTRPGVVGAVIADAGALPASTWMELDVTSLVTGDGTYEIALIPTSGDGVDFNSREDASMRPELVVVSG